MGYLVATYEYFDGSGVKLQYFKTVEEATAWASRYGGSLINTTELVLPKEEDK